MDRRGEHSREQSLLELNETYCVWEICAQIPHGVLGEAGLVLLYIGQLLAGLVVLTSLGESAQCVGLRPQERWPRALGRRRWFECCSLCSSHGMPVFSAVRDSCK
ncbi:hypothetical protein OH77DRAFT_274227 [Trametes cingulata]|nr:hypothetical protein OH77DRAFT_274227 [Trametes cingulata]